MYDDIDNERDFWHDEPTRRLGRVMPRPVTPRSGTPRSGTPLPGARVERTRQHVPVITTPARTQRRPIDPFLVRLGLMVCIGVAMVPVAMTLRHGAGDVLKTAPTGGATAVPLSGGPLTTTVPSPAPSSSDQVSIEVLADQAVPLAQVEVAATPTTIFDIDALPPATPVAGADTEAPVTTAPSTTAPAVAKQVSTTTAPTPATTAAKVVEPALAEAPAAAPTCSTKYKVVSGDYWIRIASKVGVSVKELLSANGATVDTALYPGRDICLPKGASAPAVAPATTAPVRTTPAKTTTPTTTKPTTTTAAPTTTAVPRRSYSAAEVEAIIRDVWPDDLEDEAVRVARRESNLQPAAHNSCCYGLFQIYWSVHKGWLTAMGITSADQLLDPRSNATAGLALYQRSGGWGPWAI